MELKPSTQTVYQALQALYGNSSSSEREKANVYLLNLQKSVSFFFYLFMFIREIYEWIFIRFFVCRFMLGILRISC